MNKMPSILLVEDQPDLLDNLSLTLEMAGYQIIKAKEGHEALTLLKTQPVDLILSDIVMPNMGGYQLYKSLRAHPTWAAIPFLLLTGCRFLSNSEINYGKALGIKEYLLKPIRSEQLLLAIQRILDTDQRLINQENDSKP
jgi:CheY-like chemotaxis protein